MPESIAHRDFVETQLVRSRVEPEGVMFGTKTPEQSKVVMDAIIGNSHENLWLMARALNRAVNDPYQILRAIKFEKNLHVKVIVEMADPFSCKYSALSELKSDPDARQRVEVRQLRAPSSVHLSIGDSRWTRIQEKDGVPSAIVAFNNPDVNARAADRFSLLWKDCKPLSWPTLPASQPAPV